MFSLIYSYISVAVFYLVAFFCGLMLFRLFFNYRDPNPFGKIGRFAWQLKKKTDSFVKPAADFLFLWRIDTRLAPLMTALMAIVFGMITLQILANTAFIIDGLIYSISMGNLKQIFGFILYAALSVYILLVFLRVISSYFVFTRNTLFGFAKKLTDPIVIPVQKLIPPIGMFDLSTLVVLIVLQLLQNFIKSAFIFG